LAAILLLLGASAFAQHGTEAGEHAKESTGAHAGEEEHGSLEGWKWANFLVLAGVLGYVIGKNAGPFFSARTLEIRRGMMEAEEMRAQADKRLASVTAMLANLQSDVEGLRREAREEGNAEAERMRQSAAAEMAKIQARAQQEIAAAAKAARLELKRHAAELAVSLAERRVRERITAQDQDRLVGSFVTHLAQPGPQA
jgi:F-type H+-transporting ATPase subunit b